MVQTLAEQVGPVVRKGGVVLLMSLLLLVPLGMLRGLISERAVLRDRAYQSVAAGWGGAQVVGGAVLAVPLVARFGAAAPRYLYILPDQLSYSVEISSAKRRHVGPYGVPVYAANLRVRATFQPDSIQAAVGDRRGDFATRPGHARTLVPISDVRGLRSARLLDAAGAQPLRPESGLVLPGLTTDLDLDQHEAGMPLTLELDIELAGSRELRILPLGRTTDVEMVSDWPHPSFVDGFSPVQSEISESGFNASWRVLAINRPFAQTWVGDEVQGATILASGLGVRLYQPVDLYQRNERAVKYSILFVALTFMTFFFWEQMSSRRIHAVQYALVGFAMVVFYVLLLALSEHMPFAVAYAVGALALSGLIGTYLAGVQEGRWSGVAVGAIFAVVYALLYVLIVSEQYALLLGALTLFAMLASLMIATRRVDWYSVRD